MKSPIVLLWSLLDDVKRLHPLVRGIERDSLTLNDRFKHEGLGFISKTLPTLCDAFDEGLSTGRFTCPSNFRKIRGGVLPRLFSGLLCNVFDRSTGELLSSADLGIVKTIREILRLLENFSRIRIKTIVSILKLDGSFSNAKIKFLVNLTIDLIIAFVCFPNTS